eukprot:GHVS01073502.1.p1 GENE.GHVS01073502.1~~GHVS01073502.1.p1  ORF type:complete len:672 (+),score=177.92 GHVS01073502.1:423-2438(+)
MASSTPKCSLLTTTTTNFLSGHNFRLRLRFLFFGLSMLLTFTSEAFSSGNSRILETAGPRPVVLNSAAAAAPGASSSVLPLPPLPRFAEYPLCDLSDPHAMLGLSPVTSAATISTPPTAQAVWVAYYSRVIVAEHQPKELPLAKLYCASLAARKLLFQLDPVMYVQFEHVDWQAAQVQQRTAGEEAAARARLTQSVEAGDEVGVLLLHPDVSDVSIVKALMTLGWLEMKFYETSEPVWMEWLEDEKSERESWLEHMDNEIGKIDEQMERAANDRMREQVGDRMKAEEHREQRQQEENGASSLKEEQETIQKSAASAAPETFGYGAGGDGVGGDGVGGVGVGGGAPTRHALFRRLGIREQLSSSLGRLEFERENLEAARDEMEKVNKLWNERILEVMGKWERFVGGAFERVERNAVNEDGETWEEGVNWITKKYLPEPQANKDVCEGYLLEMVLDVNAVSRINGMAWKHQASTSRAFSALVNALVEDLLVQDKNNMKGGAEGGKVKAAEDSAKVRGGVDASFIMQAEFETDIDWLVNEMLQDVDGLDMDIEELVDELLEMNDQNLYDEIIESAAGVSPDLAETALSGMLERVNEVIADMVEGAATKTGVAIDDMGDLAELMMTGAVGEEGGESKQPAEDEAHEGSDHPTKSSATGAVLPEDHATTDFASVVM